MTLRQVRLFFNEAQRHREVLLADQLDMQSLSFVGKPSEVATKIREKLD